MYCDVNAVRRILPETTYEVISDDTIMFFIVDAGERIDNALRGIYSVPFTTVPGTIKSLCAQYAAYITLTSFPDSTVEDDLKRLKADVFEYINLLRNDTVSLDSAYRIQDGSNEPYFKSIKSTDYTRWNDYYEVGE